jgi:serine/threonine-protein kinase Chk1
MSARNPFPSGKEPLIILFPGQIVSAFDVEPERSGTWPPLSLEKRISILNEIQNHQKLKNMRLSLGKEEKTINSWLKVNNYTIVKRIEKGVYGAVFKVNKDNQSFASKFIDAKICDKRLLNDIIPEAIKIARLVGHQNAVKTVLTRNNIEFTLIVMDYANGGDLCSHINIKGAIPKESLLKNWFKQMVNGVKYLHESCGVAHRDLKLEHILIFYPPNAEPKREKAILKICDFKTSVQVSDGERTDEHWINDEFIGTPEYMSPETLAQEKHDLRASDRWSLAVILFVMKNYSFPFKNYSEPKKQQFIAQQKNRQWVQTIEKVEIDISNELMDLFEKMFDPDWRTRIQFNAIENHLWLRENS